MYNDYLFELVDTVNRTGADYVEAMSKADRSDEQLFGILYGIALTLYITNEWSDRWANVFANATTDCTDQNIVQHFDFLNN